MSGLDLLLKKVLKAICDRFEERIRLMKLASEIDTRIEPAPFRPDTFVDEDR
ncbi:MAG: hypothetical protein OHK0032_15430 [Thermodesulfovibrionales bacterium]